METGNNKRVSKLQKEVSGWEVKFCLVAEGERARESGMSRAEQQRYLPLLQNATNSKAGDKKKRKERGKHINHDCESPSLSSLSKLTQSRSGPKLEFWMVGFSPGWNTGITLVGAMGSRANGLRKV